MNGRPSTSPHVATLSRRWWFVAGAVVAGAVATLFFLDPARHGFYPICLFHRLTGLDCPGCGGLRAVHQLTHGHLVTAFRLNALVVLAVPVAGGIGGRWLWWRLRGQPAPPLALRPAWVWWLLAGLLVFGVVRNLVPPPLGGLAR